MKTHQLPSLPYQPLDAFLNRPQLSERIKIDDDKMKFYEDLAEMYVGDDVSPDFYGWVFPKYDHVGVGTGTVVNRPGIKEYQKAIRDRAGAKIEGGKIIKVRKEECGGAVLSRQAGRQAGRQADRQADRQAVKCSFWSTDRSTLQLPNAVLLHAFVSFN